MILNIHEIENRKTVETKNRFFEKITEMNKHLARQIRKKRWGGHILSIAEIKEGHH